MDQPIELQSFLNRAMPARVVMQAECDSGDMVEVTAALETNSFTSIVPLVIVGVLAKAEQVF